eukprot:scpid79814/ scgid25469/ 
MLRQWLTLGTRGTVLSRSEVPNWICQLLTLPTKRVLIDRHGLPERQVGPLHHPLRPSLAIIVRFSNDKKTPGASSTRQRQRNVFSIFFNLITNSLHCKHCMRSCTDTATLPAKYVCLLSSRGPYP